MTRIPVPNDCDLQPVETIPIKKEEAREQARLVAALRRCWHLLPDERRPVIAHIPNGGQRTIMAGARLKAEGVVKGYPDIMVFTEGYKAGRDESDRMLDEIRGNMARGLALELKVWPNKPSPEQEELHALLEKQGWRVAVCYSLEAVEQVTREYFGS